MDFDFTEEQGMLRDVAREFLTEQCGPEHARKMFEDKLGYDKGTYRKLADLGLLGLPFPESYGGAGLGMVEQAVVLEEMGRVAYPGPYFAGVVLAGTAIMASGDERAMARYLPNLGSGELTMSFAFIEDEVGWEPHVVGLQVVADGDGYRLRGVKRLVPFGQSVDTIIVAGRIGGGTGAQGLTLLAVPRDTPGLGIEENISLDLNEKVCSINFDDVRVPAHSLIGAAGNAWPAIEATLRRAAVGAAAEMLGASRKSLEMSVEYAKVREQFGQPIGSFQAIKHRLAEMLEATENLHSAVYYAAWAIDARPTDLALAVSVAKSTANESSRMVCGQAIQVHGGIGYTWEYDLHIYWKRAKHLEPLYGDTIYHREQIMHAVLAGNTAMATS